MTHSMSMNKQNVYYIVYQVAPELSEWLRFLIYHLYSDFNNSNLVVVSIDITIIISCSTDIHLVFDMLWTCAWICFISDSYLLYLAFSLYFISQYFMQQQKYPYKETGSYKAFLFHIFWLICVL